MNFGRQSNVVHIEILNLDFETFEIALQSWEYDTLQMAFEFPEIFDFKTDICICSSVEHSVVQLSCGVCSTRVDVQCSRSIKSNKGENVNLCCDFPRTVMIIAQSGLAGMSSHTDCSRVNYYYYHYYLLTGKRQYRHSHQFHQDLHGKTSEVMLERSSPVRRAGGHLSSFKSVVSTDLRIIFVQ